MKENNDANLLALIEILKKHKAENDIKLEGIIKMLER